MALALSELTSVAKYVLICIHTACQRCSVAKEPAEQLLDRWAVVTSATALEERRARISCCPQLIAYHAVSACLKPSVPSPPPQSVRLSPAIESE